MSLKGGVEEDCEVGRESWRGLLLPASDRDGTVVVAR